MIFSEWKKYKLSDVCTKIGSGATPRGGKESYSDEGEYALIRSQNVLDFFFSYSGLAFINETQANKLSNVALEKDDVLLNITGDSVARVCQVPNSLLPARVNQHVAIIRPDRKKLDNSFLKYYLLNPTFKKYLLNISAVGATRNAITKGMIDDLDILLPDLKTQNHIASILSSLDDAIELNQQTNKTLEEIAQTLFAEMCLSKNGEKKNKIGDYIETISSTHKMKQEKIIFLNTSDILEGEFLHSDYSEVAKLPGQAKKSIKRNDILYSEIRPANKRFAFVSFDADDYVVSTKLMVLRSKGILNPYFIYCFLTNKEVLNQLQHLAESRSGTFPQITFTQLKEMEFVLPEKNKLDKLTKSIQSLYENIFSNNDETKNLIAIRDLLLPQLINGKIKFPNQ